MIRRLTALITVAVLAALSLAGCAPAEKAPQPLPVKVLILPKF